MLSGTVQKGKGLGRNLGFPTANLKITETYKLIPANGVYVVKARIAEQRYYGMMNIGTNPTVDGSQQHIEVHFFDYDNDLYGQGLKVELLHRIRSEQKFDSLEDLKNQLVQDRSRALSLIQST
jgi:riboflavin kinase/FMN adenylyltransferase